jgi:hypothetical protein
VDPHENADVVDDSCFMMADTIRLLLLPRTRLFRAASLAGDDHVSPLGARLCSMLLACCVQGFLLCISLYCFKLNNFVAVRAQPRGCIGEGEGLVGRLCRVLGRGKGGSNDVTCIGVCASAAGLLRMMLATGQCLMTLNLRLLYLDSMIL